MSLSVFRITVSNCWRWLLIASVVVPFAVTPTRADVSVRMSIWHGYDFYYPNPRLTATNPPLTFHWLESASGRVWRQLGDTNGNSAIFLTNDLNTVIQECTNGLWKLYLNRGHPSEELYEFAVSITDVTPEVLGNVTILFPTNQSTGVTATPTFTWTGPDNLPSIFVSASHDDGGGNSYSADLPGSATQWTLPGPLTPGPNTLFVQYLSNNFSGITLSTPTNALGVALSDWTGAGDLYSYKFSDFTVAGGTDGDSELADAVDQPTGVWTTGGDAAWFRQTDETHDGTDAAQSGAIDHDETSWIETTVTGPGVLTFWWNVSSDDSDGYDYLEFTVNGDSEAEISGDWGWDYYEINLPAGTHTLRWTYYKDGDFTAGADAAWLDEVQFLPEIELFMTLSIERTSAPLNPGFHVFPLINFIQPAPITSHEIVSPDNTFSAYRGSDGEEYSTSSVQPTLAELIAAVEAGDWTIYINRGHPSERRYTFHVTVDTLELSDLPEANITSPVEGQTGVAPDHVFTWTGPADYDYLYLYSYLPGTNTPSGGYTNLASDVVSSVMPNPLAPGTNALYLNYTRNDFPGIYLSEPEDASFQPLTGWQAQVNLVSGQTRRFVVGAAEPPATPVQILNPWHTGTNFSFSLITQAGRTHTVQSRTNLSTAPWVNVTNFIGNGDMMQLFLPNPGTPETYYRVGTQ